MEQKWITAWIDTTAEHIEFIENQFLKYNIEEYLISHESKPKHHFHLVGFTNRKNWDNMMKTFIEKFDLRTKRKKGVVGGVVKYGTLNEPIKQIDKLKAYMLKQTNGDFSSVRSKNLDASALLALYETSYEKKEKKKIYEEIHEYLESTYSKEINLLFKTDEYSGNHIDIKLNIIKKIKLKIINYLRTTTDINMCRSNIMSYTQYHLKKTIHYSDEDKDELIYALLF